MKRNEMKCMNAERGQGGRGIWRERRRFAQLEANAEWCRRLTPARLPKRGRWNEVETNDRTDFSIKQNKKNYFFFFQHDASPYSSPLSSLPPPPPPPSTDIAGEDGGAGRCFARSVGEEEADLLRVFFCFGGRRSASIDFHPSTQKKKLTNEVYVCVGGGMLRSDFLQPPHRV
jgi:hypothetical protein